MQKAHIEPHRNDPITFSPINCIYRRANEGEQKELADAARVERRRSQNDLSGVGLGFEHSRD